MKNNEPYKTLELSGVKFTYNDKYWALPNRKNIRWAIKDNEKAIDYSRQIAKPSRLLSVIYYFIFRKLRFFNLRNKFFNSVGSQINDSVVNIYFGARGVFKKNTVQEVDSNGNITYTKVAVGELAPIRLEAEYNALLILDKFKTELKYLNVPNVISARKVDGKIVALRTSSVCSTDGKINSSLSNMHHLALVELANLTISESTSINEYKRLSITKDDALSNVMVKVCLSHGDFTPWNTMITSDALSVFDWEMCDRRPVGWDLFNYIFHAEILIKKNVNCFDDIIKSNEEIITGFYKSVGILSEWKQYADLYKIEMKKIYIEQRELCREYDMPHDKGIDILLKSLS